MKTAEEILKTNTGHAHGLMDAMVIKSMKEYALEACKESLRNASDNAVLVNKFGDDIESFTFDEFSNKIWINKQSILSEGNIPKEVKS